MNAPIELLRVFILDHRSLEYIIIFLGTALGGELALFAFGFLAAQNFISLIPLFIFGFLGTFFPNILWFFIGKTNTASRVILNRYADNTTSMITQAVSNMSKDNHFTALIIIKFIIGTPFLLIMYVHKTGLYLKQFLYYETPAILLSLLVVILIGFISGLGFTILSDIFNNLYIAIGFILIIAVVIIMAKLWIKTQFTKNISK
ncbi:MAG: hypothetical protein KGL67_01650 [Patescibacteria group bacterium]|nr:hypothetical protein [Patescibacteria group bacterium]